MSIFTRLTDIVHANINSLLDMAEDPGKMIRLMIREMEDTLVEVRSAAANTISDKNGIERLLGSLDDTQAEWKMKAELALTKGRDYIAKAALVRKNQIANQIEALREEMKAYETALIKYNGDMAQLQAKLDEAKLKKKGLEARTRTAGHRDQMRRSAYDNRVDDAVDRYAEMERRIDEMEANTGTFDLGKNRSLEEEFADLEAENSIAEELAHMKAKIKQNQK